MKPIDEMLHATRLIVRQQCSDGFNGEYLSPSGWEGSIVVSWGMGWEHVSVAPYKHRITPSWKDMCDIKEMFWNDDECVVQYHPPRKEYVNMMTNCLHLWRSADFEMPMPPSFMTGLKPGQNAADIEQAMREYEQARKERKHNEPNGR